jgi:hypothetical protein
MDWIRPDQYRVCSVFYTYLAEPSGSIKEQIFLTSWVQTFQATFCTFWVHCFHHKNERPDRSSNHHWNVSTSTRLHSAATQQTAILKADKFIVVTDFGRQGLHGWRDMCELQFVFIWTNERRSKVAVIPASHSKRPSFKFRLRDCLTQWFSALWRSWHILFNRLIF